MDRVNMHVTVLCLSLPMPFILFADERSEAERLAPKYNAEVEVVLWDNTRVDLVNETYAIEVDWAAKYAQGIGQALYYSLVTNLKPGLILLVRDKDKDRKYIYRAQSVCAKYDIRLWVENVDN